MRQDELRVMAKVADLYFRQGVKQAEISSRIGVHQSSISRLLKKAEEEGIVQISVNYPTGFHPHLESSIESAFKLKQAIIVDCAQSDERELISRLGSAAATYLTNVLKPSDVIGISSWSSSLLAMAEAMRPGESKGAKVVQILGGVGNPAAEVNATHLTKRLAQITGGLPVLLGAPGIVPNIDARHVLMAQPYAKQAIDLFPDITIALVGIGAVEPSPLLANSGNAFSDDQLQALTCAGAVGDICLRFFNVNGDLVDSELNDHVIGISPEQLKSVPVGVGVAGGMQKRDAILAALRGGWIDVLVTDDCVATSIMDILQEENEQRCAADSKKPRTAPRGTTPSKAKMSKS